MKLRVGYGEVGNANVPFNATTIRTSPGSDSNNYVFGPNQDLIFGSSSSSPATDLTWEVTKEINAGFDFELLERRLSGTFDYYNRLNTNAILNVQNIPNSPYKDNFNDHGAEVRNQGYEISLNWRDNITDDLSYSIGGNFARNTNTVENIKTNYAGATGGSLGDGQITKDLKKDSQFILGGCLKQMVFGKRKQKLMQIHILGILHQDTYAMLTKMVMV